MKMATSISEQQTGNAVHRAWWKESAVYQIYPASFKDSNDDGIGDIPGIISKLDYIQKLGIDIIWVCPCYKSPQVDMGYDISDYCNIAEQYGTVEDVEQLIEGCHEREMRLLMDLVVNHTSDQHEWFLQSRSSKDSEYRNWYIWKPPRFDEKGDRHPPNNWAAHFEGSAWEYDETTGEYYLHLFAKEQPDLNWEYPPVRKAVHDIIRFWLDKGVDGFRLDVINFISKDQTFPDAPVDDPDRIWQWGHMYYGNGPRLHEYLQDIGKILSEYDAFSVGEMPCVQDGEEVLRVVRQDRGELNMIFQFDHAVIDHGKYDKFAPMQWTLTSLKQLASHPNDTPTLDIYREQYLKKARDNSRTPMQWSSASNAGFTSPDVDPWMSVNPNYTTVNAEVQMFDPSSTFNYWSSLLRLRKRYGDIFIYGDFTMVDSASEEIFAYKRMFDHQQVLVLCNWTDKAVVWHPAPHGVGKVKDVLLNSYGVSEKYRIASEKWPLRPYEATVLLINSEV
ncbi:hypothetical protein Egran_06582 [Elaphomyces granulatus]|uniref:Glycosyl hydrolase family 13 catalytic domain-containing protein n=1 Tax=Elaphomyces granulatus TaxID=519963 RepID=A0A232LNA7_9EURO|nr:hypothetical protein Egran_06582 [Elaphomyces granulatus]